MNKAKKSMGKTVLTMILLAALIIGGYFSVIQRDKNKEKVEIPSASETELQKLLKKDLTDNYPSTPREVMKLYSRITKAFYETEFTDETLSELIDQIRKLFDSEFLIINPIGEYTSNLKTEIEMYKKEKRFVFSYGIQESDLITYKKIDNRECAMINVTYIIMEKSKNTKVYEKFLLRQDSEDKWRILGWDLLDPSEIDGE